MTGKVHNNLHSFNAITNVSYKYNLSLSITTLGSFSGKSVKNTKY